MFTPGDAWVPTENLFRRDRDGDYWLMDRRDTVISTARGPVFTQPIVDTLNDVAAVDLEVAFGLRAGTGAGERTLAVAAVSVRRGYHLDPKDVTECLRALDPAQRPDLIFVVDEIPRSSTYRPSTRAVQAAVRLEPGERTWWYDRTTETYEILTPESLETLLG